MSVLKRWLVLPALLLVLAFFGVGRSDEDLKFDEKHAKAAEAIANFYAPSFDHMDHLLKTRVGYDHPGIAEEDWRALPPLFKLETAYLAAERADKDGGERMLALLAKSLSQEYEWMGTSPIVSPFLKIELPESSSIKFATLTLSDTNENRPTLTSGARALAQEISGLCTSGSKARAVLIDYFGLEPKLATTFIIERSLKDVFERAFEVIGDEKTLDQKLQKFVAAHDAEYEGFAGNKTFDPWRGFEPPPEGLSGTPVPKPRKPSGGGGVSWAKKDSGMRLSGFHFFEPVAHVEATRLSSQSDSIQYSDEISSKYQAEADRDFKRLLSDKERGYDEQKQPSFEEATKNPKGLGGIILGNTIKDSVHQKPMQLEWEEINSKDGQLVVHFADGKAVLHNVDREHAVAAYRILFSHDRRFKIDFKKEAIGLLGAYDEEWVNLSFDEDRQTIESFETLSRLAVHPSVADLRLSHDLAFCDTFPRSLELPFPESSWRSSLIRKLAVLAGNNLERLEDELIEPLAMTNGWKISDLPLEIRIQNGEFHVAPDSATSTKFVEGIPQTLLTMYTFRTSAADNDDEGLKPIAGFEQTIGPGLLQYLSATQSPYQNLNRFVAVLAVARWANAAGAEMIEVKPQKTYPPIFALHMVADRVNYISRETADFELGDVIAPEADFRVVFEDLSVENRETVRSLLLSRCSALTRYVDEKRFLEKEKSKSEQ